MPPRACSTTLLQGLMLISGLFAATSAGRTMATNTQPVGALERHALDANVETACHEDSGDVTGCVEARLARVQALKKAGDLIVALAELKACRDLDPAQFGPLAKTGPGRDLRMLGLVVSKMQAGDTQLALAKSSDNSGDRENARVLFQQGISTLSSAMRDMPKLRLGTSQQVQDLQKQLQSKVR